MVIPTCYSIFWTRAYKKKSYLDVGMSRVAYGESGDRVVAPAVKDICKHFGTIAIPPITTTLKAGLLFRIFLLLLYNFSLVNLSYNGAQAVSLEDVMRTRLIIYTSRSTPISYETLWERGGRDFHKGGNGGKIQVIGVSHYLCCLSSWISLCSWSLC